MALLAGHVESALVLLEGAAQAQLESGDVREAAALGALIGEALHRLERNEEAILRVRGALESLGSEPEGSEAGALYGVLGKALLYCGSFDQAAEPLDRALRIARARRLPALESRALIDEGVIAAQSGRPAEARTLLGAALRIAEHEGLGEEAILAGGNMANLSMQWDMPEAAEQFAEVLGRARRNGDRLRESIAAGQLVSIDVSAGRWAAAGRLAGGLLEESDERPGAEFLHFPLVILTSLMGDVAAARAHLAGMEAWARGDDDELRAAHASLLVRLALAEGAPARALEHGRPMLGPAVEVLGVTHDAVRFAWPDMLEAALALEREDEAEELLALLAGQPHEQLPPFLRAQLSRGRGLTAVVRSDWTLADSELSRAAESFDELGFTFWLARARVERAGTLLRLDRAAQAGALLRQAVDALSALGARPALELARAAGEPSAEVVEPEGSAPPGARA
jgi:tetratricopeptide (TPR) repeat protein